MDDPDVLRGYALDAKDVIPRFEALRSEDVLAPVLDLLPEERSRILDLGAGTGRDAAWLARKGHEVVAAEPVDELRQAGMALHPHPNLSWVGDRLPELAVLLRRGETYDLIVMVAVWQHLRPELHGAAMSNLASLMAPRGRLILSLRHGPGSPARPCYPASPEQLIEIAAGEGLRLLERRESLSIQQKNRERGVTWTWLCLGAPA
ncbi:MAG TPA: class I SAM-dependent methyltransferase [Allosphingosinicella sp.]|nr:class I SAM-dependent methyltransferase [Allosphingosinicella sp.]